MVIKVLKYLGRVILGAVSGWLAFYALMGIWVALLALAHAATQPDPLWLAQLIRWSPVAAFWGFKLALVGGAVFALCWPLKWGKFLGWAVIGVLGVVVGILVAIMVVDLSFLLIAHGHAPQSVTDLFWQNVHTFDLIRRVATRLTQLLVPVVGLFLFRRFTSFGQRIGAKLA